MLSNTATPRYYADFRDQVIRGEIPVCKEIAQQMRRIDRRIDSPFFYYDDEAVEGYIRFCENELTLTDGSDLHLLPTFKLWAEDLLGWYYFIDRSVYEPYPDGHGGHYVRKRIKQQLTHKQFLIVGRGAAKTLYGSSMHAYMLTTDPAATHQVATAYTMKQAEEAINPIKTAITRARGPLFQVLTEGSIQNTTGSKAARQKLASTKKGIEEFITGSLLETRPMNIDALQGFSSKGNTVDEWLSADVREDPITALEQGAKKCGDGWWIIAMSSEGNIRNGIGDTIKMELAAILKGDYVNEHTSIWWYKLDSVKEIGEPDKWIKANPNLGRNVSFEDYQTEVEQAEKIPSKRNEIYAKRFGLPLEGMTYFFTYEETLPHRHRDYWGMPCALGADLSQGDDFCAFTFLFPLANGFGIKTRAYIIERTLANLPTATRQKYEEFIKEGSLIVLEANKGVLDLNTVYDDLDAHIREMQYDVRCFGYDPYNAQAFVERWCRENTPFGVEKVIQGSRTESVPLGELKQLAEDRLLFFDEDLMTFAMGNCIVLEDTNGNRKLMKKRREDKIDPVASMMDGFIAYKANLDVFD